MPVYEFEGRRPRISRTAFVHPRAVVMGDVVIGDNCYIGPGAVLRGDWGSIRIGSGSNIQENCVIHVQPDKETILSADTHVGHGAILHGPIIEENVLIGMGAIILDGVVVERDSIIAAGSVLPTGMRVEAGKIVAGVPAKVIKEVTEEWRRRKEWGTKLYQTLPSRYRKGLKELSLNDVIVSSKQ